MTVTERVMGVGKWNINLVPSVPRSILNKLSVETVGFGHIVITKTHLDPANYSDATMLAAAKYTGVYRAQKTEFELSGIGLALWLADEDNKGNLFEANVTGTTLNLASWMALLVPPSLVVGTVTSPGGTVSQTFYLSSPRDAINVICAALGCEWRINPNFSIDAGLATVLYPATPKTVVMRTEGESGRDLNITGVQGGIELDRDLDDYSTRIIVASQGASGAASVAGATAGSVPFFDGRGNAVVMKRTVDIGQVDPANAAAFATTELGLFNTVHRAITLDATTYDISADIKVGDPLWVYDPLMGLTDTTQAQYYRGRVIYPLVTRAVGFTWPVVNGMGVYFRYYVGGVATYIDLTNYIAWETAGTQVEIGANPRPSSSGGAAIANTGKARVGWTPAIGGGITLGNGTLTGEYWISDGVCSGTISFTLGTTSAITGAISFTPPITPTNTLTELAGSGRATIGGTNYDMRTLVTAVGGIFARALNAAGTNLTQVNASATIPGPWTPGDVLIVSFSYPI